MHSRLDVNDSVLKNIEAAYSPDKYSGSTISATNHAMGDMAFLCYSRELAAIAASKAEGKVYQYILGYNSAIELAKFTLLQHEDIQDPYWSTHSADVPYVFGYPQGLTFKFENNARAHNPFKQRNDVSLG